MAPEQGLEPWTLRKDIATPKGNAVVVSRGLVSQTPVGNVSAQAAEITACIPALQMFPDESISLYTDSIYY